MKYEIGIRIRKYRELRGLSQKDLADLCKALDVSPSDLLDIQISTDNLD